MIFDIQMKPPTSTAQMKKVTVVCGRPVFYEPEKVKAAKKLLLTVLGVHKPSDPFTGAIQLKVIWLFPKGKTHKAGTWRTTRPDTDNLQKMLKDCMTTLGFWHDDAQVVREIIEKRWAEEPGGLHIEITPLDEVAA